MIHETEPEPERPASTGEEEPDWLNTEPTHPNPNPARRADYQERARPCEACE